MRLIDADKLKVYRCDDSASRATFDYIYEDDVEDAPTIDLVRCKDCKHYDTESRTFPCCTDIFGAVRYMEADGFCSKGERKGE